VIDGVADVRDTDALRAIVDDAVARLGRLDIVVANAGICVPKPWDQVTPKIFAERAPRASSPCAAWRRHPQPITQPADVADTVLFLASDESKFMTAHELAPDAGVTEF
jgi:NAD(P)-dependent dehydrogenase (short-subunit alcohol dehydrogenase family)